jgi:hypothetical protein
MNTVLILFRIVFLSVIFATALKYGDWFPIWVNVAIVGFYGLFILDSPAYARIRELETAVAGLKKIALEQVSENELLTAQRDSCVKIINELQQNAKQEVPK